MHLNRVSGASFRCIPSLAFAPARGMNVIRGLNAQGKTSVLEAILYGATSKSHRTNAEADLLRRGDEGFSIALEAMADAGAVRIEANWWRGTKRFKVNGVAQERLSDILGRIRIVFFSPEDLGLVKDSAAVRRQFLDMEISQISPPYLAALQQYRTALRQRNELLKQDIDDGAQIDAWDAQLIRHGTVLMRERQRYMDEISVFAERSYSAISDDEPLVAKYRCDVESPEKFADRLAASRASDRRRQTTTHGPHRDDIEFFVDDVPARSHASQGQQRTAALAIKLAEVQLVRERTGEYPVLMLDEVLSELDDERAHRLFTAIPAGVQTIMTTTDLDDRRAVMQPDAKRFTIRDGALRED